MTKYYTTSEVAKICNVHRNTIIGAIRKGILKIHRTPGGHARISQENLDDFCKQRSIPSGAPLGNRILLLADDLVGDQSLSAVLHRAGFTCSLAQNAFDAGYMVIEFKPDVVIVDTTLPEVDFELIARRLRDRPATRRIAIVAIAAQGDPASLERLKSAGADDVVNRPFNAQIVLERVTRQVGSIDDRLPQDERPTKRILPRFGRIGSGDVHRN
jgi:excisionase family DNA binding protein